MTVATLVADLRRQGVALEAAGGRLHYRAPQGALTDSLRAGIRAHRAELLGLLRASSQRPLPPGTAPGSPAARLEAAWREALARTRDAFATHGVTPDPETLKAATWLFMRMAGWEPAVDLPKADARKLLEAVYAGRLEARLGESGQVVLFHAERGGSA